MNKIVKITPVLCFVFFALIMRNSLSGQNTKSEKNATTTEKTEDPDSTYLEFPAQKKVLIDLNGNVYLQDKYSKYIKSISPGGFVRTLSIELLSSFEEESGLLGQFISIPEGIFMDASNFVYIIGYSDKHIFKIDPMGNVHKIDTGTVSPAKKLESISGQHLADQFRLPRSICFDTAGNVYIANKVEHNIIKISKPGFVKVLAGSGFPGYMDSGGTMDSAGTKASFSFPSGLAADYSGNIFVADAWNHRIRKIDSEGNVSTFAGSGVQGYVDGPAEFSKFNLPVGVSVDKKGNVVVADFGNNLIRKITPSGMVNNFPGIKIKASTPIFVKREEPSQTTAQIPLIKKTSLDQLKKELAGMQREKDSLRLAIKLVKEQKQLDSLQLALESSQSNPSKNGLNSSPKTNSKKLEEEINRKAQEIARIQKEKDSLLFAGEMKKRLKEEEDIRKREIAKKQREVDSLKAANELARNQIKSERERLNIEKGNKIQREDSIKFVVESNRLRKQEEAIHQLIESTKKQREKDSLWIASELSHVKQQEESLKKAFELSRKQRTLDSLKFVNELSKKQREIDSLKKEIAVTRRQRMKDTVRLEKELVVKKEQTDSLHFGFRAIAKRKRQEDSIKISLAHTKKQRERDSLKMVNETIKRNREADSLRLAGENIRNRRVADSLKIVYANAHKKRERDSLEVVWEKRRKQSEADSLRLIHELARMKREQDSLFLAREILLKKAEQDSLEMVYAQIKKEQVEDSLFRVQENEKKQQDKDSLLLAKQNTDDSHKVESMQKPEKKTEIAQPVKKNKQEPSSSLIVNQNSYAEEKEPMTNLPESIPVKVKKPIQQKTKEDKGLLVIIEKKDTFTFSKPVVEKINPAVEVEDNRKEEIVNVTETVSINIRKVNPNITFYLDENHFISTITELKDTILLKMVDKFGRELPYKLLILHEPENNTYREISENGDSYFLAEVKDATRVMFRRVME